MSEYSIAEEVLQEKISANKRRTRNRGDRIKAERAKDYIRFPSKKPTHAVPEELQIDLRRVKKVSDLPEE